MDWFFVKFMPLAIYALLAFGAGAFLLWRQLKKSRSPKIGQPALLAWQARVKTGFREEPFLISTLILHDFLLLPMAVLCFVAAIRGQQQASISIAPLTWQEYPPIYYATIAIAVSLAWYTLGTAAAFWYSYWKPWSVLSMLTEEGIYRGQMLIHWTQFSHGQADDGKMSITLYSKKCPQFGMLNLSFPSQAEFGQARDLIQKRLPRAPSLAGVHWHQSKLVFALLLLLTIVPFLLIGLAIYKIPAVWVWSYFGIATLMALLLGQLVSSKYV